MMLFTTLLIALAPLFAASGDTPSAEEILRKALQRAEWAEEQNFRGRYRFQYLTSNEKLNGKGQVREKETRLYENIPVNGSAFERLLEKDGRPLTEKERLKERRREAEFRQKLKRGKPPEEDGNRRMVFDEELASRFRFELQSREQANGLDCWVLSFKPREGDLPVRRRIDRTLNKSAGKIWVDTETDEIVRVHFKLIEKVRLWWGMIGSISQLEGTVDRSRIASNDWFPTHVEFYLKGRILFNSLHFRRKVRWSGFEEARKSE
ncbi:MAG: hypothetical protein V3T83_11015 [Acidobacteriota bacterium]